MMRRLFVFITVIAVLLSLASCNEVKPEYGYAEIRLELGDGFSKTDTDGVYDAAYSDGRIFVGIIRMSFSVCEEDGIPATVSVRMFSKYYKERALADIAVSETVSDGDVVYFSYEMTSVSGEKYTYLPTFFKTPYAYFVITYVMTSEEFGRNGFIDALEYAHTTRVDVSDVIEK